MAKPCANSKRYELQPRAHPHEVEAPRLLILCRRIAKRVVRVLRFAQQVALVTDLGCLGLLQLADDVLPLPTQVLQNREEHADVFGRGRLPSVGVPEPAGILLEQLKAGGACAAGQRAEQRTNRADEQGSPPPVLRHVAPPPLGGLLIA